MNRFVSAHNGHDRHAQRQFYADHTGNEVSDPGLEPVGMLPDAPHVEQKGMNSLPLWKDPMVLLGAGAGLLVVVAVFLMKLVGIGSGP